MVAARHVERLAAHALTSFGRSAFADWFLRQRQPRERTPTSHPLLMNDVFTLRVLRRLHLPGDVDVLTGALLVCGARTAAQLIVDGAARLADPGDARRLQECVDELDRQA